MSVSKSAYFLIADISGYTRFLTSVELDHAHGIISDLMNALVTALRPPLRLAKFEGDAVFLYCAADKVDGAVLQDTIESAYFAFRRRLRDIGLSTTCECKACSQMPMLDLKFVCHHGEYVEHTMAGRKEIAGKDVIVVHRFLKNTVTEDLGLRAYALYSEACVVAMAVDAQAQGLVPHAESIDLIGDVPCRVRDLHAAWKAETQAVRTCVARDEAALVVDREVAGSRATVWEYLTVPALRRLYQQTDGVVEAVVDGRRGTGTTNHCMHGKEAVLEEIVDWRPGTYVTLTKLLPIPGATKLLLTLALEDLPDGGTHVEMRLARPKPREAAFVEKVSPVASKKYTEEFAALDALLRARAPGPELPPEPDLAAPRTR